jgi:predicted neuraminidase
MFSVLAAKSVLMRLLLAVMACGALVAGDQMLHGAKLQWSVAEWPMASSARLSSMPSDALTLVASGHIPMPDNTPAAHASSLLAMPIESPFALMAFWFAGERESAADVQIAVSGFDRTSQQWRKAQFVLNREVLSEQLGFAVRRLGNPAAWLDREGKIHLFVVSTGLGGWAAARIVHLQQTSSSQELADLRFGAPQVLPLSWLWNTSFLVRTAPLYLADGGLVLPVHFELGLKYPALLRFNAQGQFQGLVRVSNRSHLLQPSLLMLTPSHWLALMRDQSSTGKVAVAETLNAGESWRDQPDLALNNSDSSVAGLALAPGQIFFAHNSSPHSRKWLDLSSSADGRNWMMKQMLARGSESAEYSYPALAWADGSLWVSYTDQRKRIAWQRFALNAADP